MHGMDLGKADIAEFGFAKAEIAQTKETIRILGISHGEKPGGGATRAIGKKLGSGLTNQNQRMTAE